MREEKDFPIIIYICLIVVPFIFLLCFGEYPRPEVNNQVQMGYSHEIYMSDWD
jgi:hypothetical protein